MCYTKYTPKMHPKAGRKGKLPAFPQVVGKKPNHAVIYHRSNGVFTVKWKQGATWVNKTKTDYKSAILVAKEISLAKRLERLPEKILTPLEVEEYIYCRKTSTDEGVGLQQAIQEWKNAKGFLPKGASLQEVVKAHAKSIQVKDLSVHDLVDAWAKEKINRGSTEKYLRSVEVFRKRIKAAFSTSVRSLDALMLIEWLDSISELMCFSPKTYNENVTFLKSILKYAMNYGYLPSDSRIANALVSRKVVRKSGVFITPDEFEAIYSRSHQRIKGRLLLIGFLGFRPEEACEFNAVDDVSEKSLIVRHDSAKTGWRRSISIDDLFKRFILKKK